MNSRGQLLPVGCWLHLDTETGEVLYFNADLMRDVAAGPHTNEGWKQAVIGVAMLDRAGNATAELLQARHTIDTLSARLQALIDMTEPLVPEKNCACHLSPPCDDCVEYWGVRDALENANSLLQKLNAAAAGN